MDTFSLTISNSSTFSIKLENIVFGDIYLCAGQSNMELAVSQALNATEEISDSVNYPNLRLFYVPKELSTTPLDDFSNKTQWKVSNPQTVGGKPWTYFSAICYFFGRDLYNFFQGKLPIGLIESSWGGTYIQAWSSPDSLKKCPTTDHTPSKVQNGTNPNQPSVLFNAMINPFIFSGIQFNGVLWYQGEANSFKDNPYACFLQNMIADWREKMQQFFAFFIVQLAAYESKTHFFPFIREAQDSVARHSPHTYLVTAIDLGDPKSEWGTIHPRNKQQVSQRLANKALFQLYGHEDITSFSPVAILGFIDIRKNDTGYQIIIPFTSLTGDLEFRNPVGCEAYGSCCNSISSNYNPFVVVTDDKKTVYANNTEYKYGMIVLHVVTDAKPVFLYYAYENYPKCLLFDTVTNLPAFPFVSAIFWLVWLI